MEAPITGKEANQWNMFCHLGVLVGGLLGGFGSIIVPIVIWQMKKNEFPSVEHHAKEALNFLITTTIACLLCIPLIFVMGLGFILLLVISVASLILVIIAAIKANDGVEYRYPYSVRFIK